jgi:Protein of unknown function (DUF4238)
VADSLAFLTALLTLRQLRPAQNCPNHTVGDKRSDMLQGRINHYIPVFYQKPWCGADHRLSEYSRPYKTIIARRRYPTETGFERDLYTLNVHSPAVAEIVEDRLMRQTDQYAALAHQLLLKSDIAGLDAKTRSGWLRFTLSLMRRTPEAFQALGDRIATALIQEFSQLALLGDPGNDDQALARSREAR